MVGELTANWSVPELIDSKEEECRVFTLIIYVVIYGAFGLFGLIGNTLSFLVLQWEKRNSAATFLLQALCMADNAFLFLTMLGWIYSSLKLFYPSINSAMPYIVVLVWPLVYIAQMTTIWITVLVAANRYVAICRPFQAPILCTRHRVQIQVLLTVLGTIIYNIPRFIEHYLTEEQDPEDRNVTKISFKLSTLKLDQKYTMGYETVLYSLFYFFAPFAILVVLNVCLIRELWAAKRRLRQRQPATIGDDEDKNLTLVMIVIMLTFLVCQAPALVNQILNYLISKNSYQCGLVYFYYYHLSNLIGSLNSSVNFIIYFMFRSQFRQRLRAFCNCDRMALKHMNTYYSDGNSLTVYGHTS